MKLWIVYYIYNDTFEIYSVATSPEKAQNLAKKVNEAHNEGVYIAEVSADKHYSDGVPVVPYIPKEKKVKTKLCQYDGGWSGMCKQEGKPVLCEKHNGIKCHWCGEQAWRECDHTSQLVCGAPLCRTCTCRHF